MTGESAERQAPRAKPDWYATVAHYAKPDRRRAALQLLDTALPYAALWILMALLLRAGVPYWTILPLVVLASGLLVRLFILFHDCCHGAFFPSRRANTVTGNVLGVLTFTPFAEWRRQHALHHAAAGDLDRRGAGDIWTLTAAEYASAPWRKRLLYRIVRNPFLMLLVGPAIVFLVIQRFPYPGARRSERLNVWLTDLGIVALFGGLGLAFGFGTMVAIQLPISLLAGATGVWLFYVQHQFEGVYWARHAEWDPFRAALEGSSYYRLPRVLQWITGNIGLHHIHHIRPGIPNYQLQRCYDEVPAMQAVPALTLARSLRSMRLRLWDEARQRLVGFREARAAAPPNASSVS
jgi:omega-6 fatty acid desaturase (delta-12 desaturase)